MNIPNHVGFIPDGNRRFAQREGISLLTSYLKGSRIALDTICWARQLGVKHISFFGTSSDNVLRRPASEMQALRKGVLHFCNEVLASDTPLHLVGSISEMTRNPRQRREFRKIVRRCRNWSDDREDIIVHADINYSGEIRNELRPLFRAIRQYGLPKIELQPERFISSAGVPPVDLVIRMGGKPRLSGFLPFQTTYAELYFRDELWGDFDYLMFSEALQWFTKQDRSQGA